MLDTVNTNSVLQKHGLRPIKSLGQNFLTDPHIIDKIVEAGDVSKADLVLEIGPGIGAMTVRLAKAAGRVVAVEIDRHLLPALEDVLDGCDNTQVVHADILKTDLHALVAGWNGPLKVISNLPYYITTPIIMHLLESDVPWQTLVFMVQKEVAQRLAAPPGGKDYSALSVAVRCLSEPKLCFSVSRNCFHPRPDVDSAVVRMRKARNPEVEGINRNLLRQVVRAAFSQRRKTIVNSLGSAPWIPDGKQGLRAILAQVGISESERAERLTLRQFAEVTTHLEAAGARVAKNESELEETLAPSGIQETTQPVNELEEGGERPGGNR